MLLRNIRVRIISSQTGVDLQAEVNYFLKELDKKGGKVIDVKLVLNLSTLVALIIYKEEQA